MDDVAKAVRGFADGARQLVAIAMICGTILYGIILVVGRTAPQPANPQPGPNPQPFASLEERVQQAIGHDPDLALRYATLYEIATDVVQDTNRKPRQIQAQIKQARIYLGLESNPEFDAIKRSQLSQFSGSRPDRNVWAKSIGELSQACLEAAR